MLPKALASFTTDELASEPARQFAFHQASLCLEATIATSAIVVPREVARNRIQVRLVSFTGAAVITRVHVAAVSDPITVRTGSIAASPVTTTISGTVTRLATATLPNSIYRINQILQPPFTAEKIAPVSNQRITVG